MRKILVGLCACLLFLFVGGTVRADKPDDLIPERNGDYAQPGHPGVRVRVFVHEPKEKLSSQSALSCVDNESSAIVGPAGWKLSSTVWTYRLNVSSVPSSVGGTNLETIAANGFGAWVNALATSSSEPNFTKGANTSVSRSSYDGQNVIAWGRTSGSALAVTYVRYYTSTGMVVDVDTIMNKKFLWSWANNLTCGDPNSYDAQNILTHEQGHWMGLNDEYTASFVDNTMYGYGSKNEVKKDTLTNGDKLGVISIYP